MKTFKIKAEKVFLSAEEQVLRFNSPALDAEHILLALVDDSNNYACKILKKLGIDLGSLKRDLEDAIKKSATGHYDLYPITPRIDKILVYAQEFAEKSGNKSIDTEHILFGILKENTSLASKMLYSKGIDLDKIASEIK